MAKTKQNNVKDKKLIYAIMTRLRGKMAKTKQNNVKDKKLIYVICTFHWVQNK